MIRLCKSIRKESKPMIIAANKFDSAIGHKVPQIQTEDKTIIPTSAAAELALKSAAKAGFISYTPGAGTFEITATLSPAQKKKFWILTAAQAFKNVSIVRFLKFWT